MRRRLLSLLLVGVQQTISSSAPQPTTEKAPSQSPLNALVIAGVAAMFLSFGAGLSMRGWLSLVLMLVLERAAGLMLSIGAALGIAIRVGWGMRLDRMSWHPFVIAGVMVFGGAIGAIGLTGRSATIHIIATVVAFSGGWIWPVFLNFGVVRVNEGTRLRRRALLKPACISVSLLHYSRRSDH